MKIKKFLKVLLITILVLCAIGGTAFLFFKNMKKQNNTTGSIYAQATTGAKQKFDSNLLSITDSRFSVVNKTNKNLTDIAKVLSTYIVETNTIVTNEKISEFFKKVDSNISKLNNMIAEFNKKSTSTFYVQDVGLNDMFTEVSAYIKDYSKFLIFLNNSLKNVDKSVDVKFAMMELYCQIAEQTFSETIEVSGLKNLKDSSNIDRINQNFELSNSNLVVAENFSLNSNQFVKNYNSCNQKTLASNFVETLNSVSSYSDDLSYEAKVAFFYKKIYNIG